MSYKLADDEFDVVVNDSEKIVVYDRQTNRTSEFNKQTGAWKFSAKFPN